MKLFIKKSIYFLTIFSLLLCIVYLTGIWGKEAISYYKLPNNVRYVMLGHSHPECAYNDSLIDNFKNFANSGEAYFYTYLKARKILSENKQIVAVFIEYSNNQVNKNMDNCIWDDTYLPIRLPTYLPLMGYPDLKLLVDNNLDMFINQIAKAILTNIFHSYKTILTKGSCLNNNMRFGGYYSQTRSVMDSLIIYSNLKEGGNNSFEISKLNIKYLEKTIRLCEKYEKQVILIRTPIHNNSPELGNEDMYKKILKDQFVNDEYVDFNQFKLENAEFYDWGHLNSHGAKRYSEWFNELIKNGLINCIDKQAFINANIKARMHNREDG